MIMEKRGLQLSVRQGQKKMDELLVAMIRSGWALKLTTYNWIECLRGDFVFYVMEDSTMSYILDMIGAEAIHRASHNGTAGDKDG